MKNVIYCFSGTGNSLRASRLIAAQIGGAEIINVKKGADGSMAADADMIGFVCPVYEWDIPEPMKQFISRLDINRKAYCFMTATYIGVHGRCFETVDRLLRKKGTRLHYGRALRCVASQCIAYEPFPPARFMVPYSDRCAVRYGREIAERRHRPYPRMSIATRCLYDRMMKPFMEVQREFDKGFFTTDKCRGCGLCSRICPLKNITMSEKRPVWNHRCIGCNACVVYCPTKAISFRTPKAYAELDNPVTRRLGLPKNRTRYHNPHITAKDILSDGETI